MPKVIACKKFDPTVKLSSETVGVVYVIWPKKASFVKYDSNSSDSAFKYLRKIV